jgi:hypothetical protein
MTPSGIELATFRLVTQSLSQLRHRVVQRSVVQDESACQHCHNVSDIKFSNLMFKWDVLTTSLFIQS